MKTQRRRGFTVVELVVVIAIIAVLAAVLIPTFTSIIKKANDSAYLQERQSQQIADLAEKVEKINYFTWEDFEKKLAEELAKVDTSNTSAIESAVNKAIAKYAENQQSGNTGLTAEQVQKIVNESMKGQLTTAQVEAIVNQAVASVSGANAAEVQAIVRQALAGMGQTGLNASQVKAQIAAVLASSDLANKESVEAAIAQALAKFDTLSEQEVAAIVSQAIKDTIPSEGTIYIDGDKTLEAGKTYILRTQKSIETVTLTVPNGVVVERIIVDAPNVKTVNIVYADGATVKEYVKIVEIVSTAMTSTHINVNAETVEVNKGRAVVGDSATVTVATVTAAPSTNANVVIELAENATVTSPVIAEYQDNGTGTNDTITIIDNTAGVGVKLTASNELVASGTTTTNVQIQGANISTGNVENNVATTTNNVEIVEVKINDTTYVIETDDSASEYSLFAGGSGTPEDPFLIFDYATMQNISKFYNEGYYYFAVDMSKTNNGTIDCTNWISVNLNGSFDGKGVKFINLDWRLFGNIKGGELSYIHNFDIVSCHIVGDYSSAVCNQVLANHVLFENVNITGYVEGNSWAASYISYAGDYGKKMTLTFKNCESSAVLVSGGSCAGFIGHPGNIGSYEDSRIEIIDSKFNGTISHPGTSAYYIAYCYVTNKVLYFNYSENYDYSGLYTLGSPSSLGEKDENGFQHYNNTVNNGFGTGGIIYTKENSVVQLVQQNVAKPEKYESFSIEALSSTTKATFVWTIGYTASTGGTNWTAGYIKETVDKDAEGYVTSTFKYYDLTLNGSSTTSTGLASDGKTFNVVNPVYVGEPDSNFITITEYNSVGAVVRITKINLK